mgnify:CR=1 FL=1
MVLNERLDLKTNLQSSFRLKEVLHKVLELFFYWGGHIDPPPPGLGGLMDKEARMQGLEPGLGGREIGRAHV